MSSQTSDAWKYDSCTCAGYAGCMKPSFMRLTGTSFPALNAARKLGVTLKPQPGLARCSSYTDRPSDTHRGIRWSVEPSVKVCASSCQNVEPQLNGPASFAAGESNASVVPKLTPSAPSPARPTVRTEKSAWLRYTSMRIGGGGVYAYFFENVAYA